MVETTSMVQSAVWSLQDFITKGCRFSVPRYQRLYVWEAAQVNTLVDDLLTAAASSHLPYYLGGILVVRSPQAPDVFDLIDGQQRLTTLWLLSLALGQKAGSPLADFAAAGTQPRLAFAIREAANAYFEAQLHQTAVPALPDASPGLRRITQAYELLKHRLTQAFDTGARPALTRPQFGRYVRRQVRLIVTEVPASFDLNHLFETSNNRGVQLQHHEILKSRLLAHLPNRSQRAGYAKLWNACANMEGYLEHNLAQEARQNVAGWYDEHAATFEVQAVLAALEVGPAQAARPVRLNQLLAGKATQQTADSPLPEYAEAEAPDAADDELETVRSILSFPQLLLHTLRIFLFQRRLPDLLRLSEKELLQAFHASGAISDATAARQFIRLLWRVRQCFDAFVIKWVKTPLEEVHAIKVLRKRKPARGRQRYLRREPATGPDYPGLELLQSMLYHSQQITTQYWLTPFLYHALQHPEVAELYDYLKRLDNQLFCADREENLALRTRLLLGQQLRTRLRPCHCNYLDEGRGVRFAHYWFYKLDFVLWHELAGQRPHDERWRTFRFTAKNSVEHVSPQQPRPEDRHTLTPALLDDFGNLALVARSINSEASNKAFLVKQQEFYLKTRPDSLKSALLYECRHWDDQQCLAHREQMKTYLRAYFARYA